MARPSEITARRDNDRRGSRLGDVIRRRWRSRRRRYAALKIRDEIDNARTNSCAEGIKAAEARQHELARSPIPMGRSSGPHSLFYKFGGNIT
jgi:hypothetical protein